MRRVCLCLILSVLICNIYGCGKIDLFECGLYEGPSLEAIISPDLSDVSCGQEYSFSITTNVIDESTSLENISYDFSAQYLGQFTDAVTDGSDDFQLIFGNTEKSNLDSPIKADDVFSFQTSVVTFSDFFDTHTTIATVDNKFIVSNDAQSGRYKLFVDYRCDEHVAGALLSEFEVDCP